MDEIDEADQDRMGRIISNMDYELCPEDIEMIKVLLVVERKQTNGKLRECLTCRLYKPDRSHHCRMCGRCVMRMDHHCPWVSNCIGWANYKFFMLMLFYALTALAIIIVAMLPRFIRIFRPVIHWGYFIRMDIPIFFAYSISVMLFPSVGSFFMFHMYLVFNAMTTIELKEKKNSLSEEVHYRYTIAHIKYDRGYWRNFCHVFGPPWLWFFPIRVTDNYLGYDGTYAKPSGTIK